MTLQEKILEALGERALPGRALYQALSGENAAAVDVALGQLLKRGLVTKELGAYQRAKHRGITAAAANPPAPVQPTKAVPAPQKAAPATAKIDKPAASGAPTLTPREREVLELVGRGMTSKMIGDQLRTQKGNVDYWRWNACRKLGLRGKAELIAWLCKNPVAVSASTTNPAPAAAARVSAAPSHEGAEVATAGAAPSNEVEKREVPPPAPRYSPDLRARLIQVQQAKAEQLQWLLKIVDAARQELRDIEAMVRGVSEEQA